MVEDVCPLPGAGQNRPLPLLLPHHIYIEDFKFADEKTTGEIRYNGENTAYNISFIEFEGFTCVFAY